MGQFFIDAIVVVVCVDVCILYCGCGRKYVLCFADGMVWVVINMEYVVVLFTLRCYSFYVGFACVLYYSIIGVGKYH